MVVHEPRVGAHRELREGCRVGGPDRGAERDEELLLECRRVAAALEELGDRLVVVFARGSGRAQPVRALPPRLVGDEASGGSVEAHDLGHEPEEPGIHQVAALGEQRVEVGAAVLQTGAGIGDAEAHLSGVGRDVELLQQGHEPGVVGLVVDDEPGVDCVVDAVDLDIDRVRVATDAVVRFEDGQLVVGAELVGGDEARHAGPDDRDPHVPSSKLWPCSDEVTAVTRQCRGIRIRRAIGSGDMGMAHFVDTITTPWSPEAAFAYMADVRNFAEWDPGTRRAVLAVGDGPGLGAAYDLDLKVGPATLTWRYEIVEWDPPRRLVVRSETATLTSVDEIRVGAAAAGATVTYDTTLTLRGIARVSEPFLAVALQRLGRRGANGLRVALDSEAAGDVGESAVTP